ncbi:uncharacterized protein MONOS_8442 [Monocercomonoides exilis]|uniref:uncharacterized protein n=1 Tax=Monocercomonoides exilis TaxID=2049356 RepID=UPI0035598AE7|nr:hypothetical protein MONOS_8442 [Monocercomonoides exilis]|eukprot:MONOS_8442.1-p1 / transcript=MONOS_8442.1 / gene=MONOS_8442 / organism=Monocercomonoides_exilis_PA203 / gene_product=unspecified product / transcript_product=unspecified product / location=Mono_scaffold00318:30334-31651(-) / protein_length=420 / sequence_SO=supercontig / SO=protein_coding / is_pseudo=false
MEGEVHFLLGRCPIAGSRSSQAEVCNTRYCRVVSTVGLNHQQGEERVVPQEELQLSQMDEEYEQIDSLNGTTETHETDSGMFQMDEDSEEEHFCKDMRLRFFHRTAQHCIEEKKDSCEGAAFLNRSIKRQLDFWIQRLKENYSRELMDFSKPDSIYVTDVSQRACKATLIIGGERFHFYKQFSNIARLQTSNFKELLAGLLALNNFSSQITHNHVSKILLRSDNFSVVFNIYMWCAGTNLLPLLRKIKAICQSKKLMMTAIKIPGEKNGTTETSFRLEATRYNLKRSQCLKEAERALGATSEIYAFANERNKRMETRHGAGSQFTQYGLTADLTMNTTLIHPPIPLILPSLKKTKAEITRAIILIQRWKNKIWSNLLEEMTFQYNVWSYSKTVFIPGAGVMRTGAALPPGGYMVASINW